MQTDFTVKEVVNRLKYEQKQKREKCDRNHSKVKEKRLLKSGNSVTSHVTNMLPRNNSLLMHILFCFVFSLSVCFCPHNAVCGPTKPNAIMFDIGIIGNYCLS